MSLIRSATKGVLAPLLRRIGPKRRDLPLSSWRLQRGTDGALVLDGVVLDDLLARWGSPLHVVDAAKLTANVAAFTARPAGCKRACEVYYSYKTNPVPGVLRLLRARGIGAEVVSPYELWLALRLGVDPARIVYNGPWHSDESLELALERGVGLVNLNAREEVARVAAIASARGVRPNIGIRVVQPGGVGGQFGERIDTGAALETFRQALSHPELRVVALHAHFNGEIASAATLEAFLSSLLAFVDELRSKLGLELEVIDVGGNLACSTVSRLSASTRRLAISVGREPTPRPPENVLSIEEYVSQVVGRIESHYAHLGRSAPRIFLEPGRAMTSNAQMLLCRVTARHGADEAGLEWIVLDAGINVAESVRNEFHQLFATRARQNAPLRRFRLTGPSCTLGDLLYPAWTLPEVEVGDGLAIMDSGAYFVPFSTCFSFARPAVVVLVDGHDELARRRETFEHLVALDEAAP